LHDAGIEMLTIRKPTPALATDDPVALLQRDLASCHEKIRRFTRVSIRLSEAPTAPPEEIAGAARLLVDYFGRALPLHVLDEDESLRPRLQRARPGDPALARALALMTEEHGPLDALVAAGVRRWEHLVGAPADLPGMRLELGELGRALELGFHGHLASEEAVIFPAISCLDEEDVVAIRHEIHARRRAPR
jgi:iron-sulfur cluster repair protein YtfE (RIC family)